MPRDSQILYHQVADDLRRQIRTGHLQPGNKLPSERALEGLHQVSRNTVRLALDELINEGLITSMQGKGYYVRQQSPLPYFGMRLETKVRGSTEWRENWMTDVRERGRNPATDVTVTTSQPPPPEVAEALEIGETEPVVRRQRTNYVDGSPYAIAQGYYPKALVEDSVIEKADDIDVEAVLAELGHKPETYVDRIVTRRPRPDEDFLLDLDRGSTVADFIRTGYDANGRPVRTQVTTLPGDRFTIVYELPAD